MPDELARRVRECAEFFSLPELAGVTEARRRSVLAELEEVGAYVHTYEELLIGARLAWRNHARCVGRKHWRSLQLIDARDAATPEGIVDACRRHLASALRGNAMHSVITVGPQQRPDGRGFRIVNPQLIRYAGYRRDSDEIVGDPLHVELTELAQKLGWNGEGTRFDVLPWIIEDPDGDMHLYEIPPELVREVDIVHPEFSWFSDLELKWHAVPAVSDMRLEVGGITYQCAPFNGWYVNTEVGARNFTDEGRYNMLEPLAERMGLDTSSDRTLWRDQALVELNKAVLHSYRIAGVYMVDHHTVAKQFLDHVAREADEGRACPTDWSWINPPMSSGLTPTYHRYYPSPEQGIRPNFVYAKAIEPEFDAPTACPVNHRAMESSPAVPA